MQFACVGKPKRTEKLLFSKMPTNVWTRPKCHKVPGQAQKEVVKAKSLLIELWILQAESSLLTFSVSSPAGGGMSLSPVTGTEVPETANGVVTPVPSENGRHAPVSGKCGGSRVPCSRDPSEDGALVDTENHVDVESRIYDGEGHLETYNNQRTSSVPSDTSHAIDTSLPAATVTGGAEVSSRDTVISEDSNTVGPPGAAALRDSAPSKDSGPQREQATTYRHETDGGADGREEEEEDGEKEKQDEEEDEKNENKWIHQHAGGRTEVEVGAL